MLNIHFGLEGFAVPILYTSFVIAFFLSACWKPVIGLWYIAPLLPLQTVRYRLIGLPLGSNIIVVTIAGVALGLLIKRHVVFPRTALTRLLYVYSAYIFISFCLGSFYLGLGAPIALDDPRLMEWKDYMVMPLLFLLAAGAVRNTRDAKILMLLMCLGILLLDKGAWGAVSGRDFSSYSEDLRDGGPMGLAGANGLAAFEAQAAVFLLAIACCRGSLIQRGGALFLGVTTASCLLYSLSRGAYAGFLVAFIFLGVIKQRTLLVIALFIVLLGGTSLAPEAVRSRVQMTYADDGELDHSSETRLTLWQDAFEVFKTNEVVGTGFDTYAYLGRVGDYRDTHNIYVKALAETGVVGVLLLLSIMVKTYRVGYGLFRVARDPFFAATGLGLAAWVVCMAVTNCFGDRWTAVEVNGYMWVIAGVVARGYLLPLEVAPASSKFAAYVNPVAPILLGHLSRRNS